MTNAIPHILWSLINIPRLYYTQFVGHPSNRPTIIGSDKFIGIGLIDTDPYIPDGYSRSTSKPEARSVNSRLLAGVRSGMSTRTSSSATYATSFST